ncbi:hypothetical protein [Ammoniphilus resinae]|uniref:Uncharacterized protein n=1 Tax=Ammoniphilus resinae TaxID=861532 RepID=A0ABS4GYS6_9BACL|nr:hypothetical protein [Ammoniphilus resinae]MBP1935035.1 hypothetical protein [Ammoniphilus resinae]
MKNQLLSHLIDLGAIFHRKCNNFYQVVGEPYYETETTYSIECLILEVAGFKNDKTWDRYFNKLEDVFSGKMEKSDFLKKIQSTNLDPKDIFSKIVRITKHLRNKERNLEQLFEREILYMSNIQWELEDIAFNLLGITEYLDEVLNQFYDGEIDVQKLLEEIQK